MRMAPSEASAEIFDEIIDCRFLRDGKAVGYLSGGGWGYTIGKAIGLGYVRNPDGVDDDFLTTGRYELEVAAARLAACARERLRVKQSPRGPYRHAAHQGRIVREPPLGNADEFVVAAVADRHQHVADEAIAADPLDRAAGEAAAEAERSRRVGNLRPDDLSGQPPRVPLDDAERGWGDVARDARAIGGRYADLVPRGAIILKPLCKAGGGAGTG